MLIQEISASSIELVTSIEPSLPKWNVVFDCLDRRHGDTDNQVDFNRTS